MCNAFQNPTDKIILGELVWWNRVHSGTQPLLDYYLPIETAPGTQYTTNDDTLNTVIDVSVLSPKYIHSSGACLLMLVNLGGCVDSFSKGVQSKQPLGRQRKQFAHDSRSTFASDHVPGCGEGGECDQGRRRHWRMNCKGLFIFYWGLITCINLLFF